MKFKNILFDFDDTLVDFMTLRKKRFYNLAQKYNHQPTQQDFEHFKKSEPSALGSISTK